MTTPTVGHSDASSPSGDAGRARDAGRTPLPGSERIATLDVLRGVALLGIFVVNVQTFGHSLFVPSPPQDGSLDGTVTLLRELLFAGKFNLLFGMVFGIGFSLQLRRLEAAEPASADRIYLRRLCVLLAIALVHAAYFWMGDVLVAYSVLGLLLLAVRRVPDRILLLLLALCLVYPAVSDLISSHLFSDETVMMSQFRFAQLAESNDAAFGHGSLLDAVGENLRVFQWAYATPMGLFNVAAFFVQMATGILIGFSVGRRRWIERSAELRGPLRRAQWSVLALAMAAGAAWWALGGSFDDEIGATITVVFARTIGRASLMLFYALTIVRCVDAGIVPRLWRLFAMAGRMPLTNYLLQTLMGLSLYDGWGLGLWGRTRPLTDVGIAVGLYVCIQWPLSAWWLSRFRYGPVEYVWRRLTYGLTAD